jgi:hypothetical protein
MTKVDEKAMPTAEEAPVSNFAAKKADKEDLDAFLADVGAGTDAEWESYVVPAWNNRTVWVRSLTSGERSRVRREGYRQVKDPTTGELTLVETGELEPLIVLLAAYRNKGDAKPLFPQDPKGHALLKRQRAGVLDELVAAVLRMSGMTKKEEKQAADDFLSSQTSGSDSDSLEI